MRVGRFLVAMTIASIAGIMIIAATAPWLIFEARDRLVRVAGPYIPAETRRAMLPDVPPPLEDELKARQLAKGAPVYLRIFKTENQLEVWLRRNGVYELFRSYPICYWSGTLGPKLMEGDGQSPEGFYRVSKRQLNPNSTYHLSFNLGYPNAYDKSQNRTGSYLMVHGACVSIGCYAMTDAGITDIYGLVAAALDAGQKRVQVDVFPFRMTAENMEKHQDSRWIEFWRNLKTGYDAFEKTGEPPTVSVCQGTYDFSPQVRQGCQEISAW